MELLVKTIIGEWNNCVLKCADLVGKNKCYETEHAFLCFTEKFEILAEGLHGIDLPQSINNIIEYIHVYLEIGIGHLIECPPSYISDGAE